MKNQLNLAFLILLTSLTGINVNAQQKKTTKPATTKSASASNKATKAETMDWIAGKMKENLAAPREFVSYSNGIITYRKNMGTYNCISTFDLNKITTISEEYSSDFYVGGKGSGASECDNAVQTKNYFDFLSIAGPNFKDYGTPFEFNTDKALTERMRKAFTVLVEYNSTKQAAGEKF